MKLLAIDTAGNACSAALWHDGKIVSSRFLEMTRGQAEAVMPMIMCVMGEGRMEFSALDAIAVTIGPGSFTGLRTGLAAARGLALSRSLPLVGVTTTEAIALAGSHQLPGHRCDRPVTVLLNSRRNDLYVQHFASNLSPLGVPFAALPEDIVMNCPGGGVIFAGDALDQIKDIVAGSRALTNITFVPVVAPDAVFVASVAADKWSNCSVKESLFPQKLLYSRAPEAALPVGKGQLRP